MSGSRGILTLSLSAVLLLTTGLVARATAASPEQSRSEGQVLPSMSAPESGEAQE